MTDSQTLLAEYVRTGSEAAFRDLVQRYIGLVYSAALRLVHGDTHLAEDVTQLVFIDLARKARGLSSEVMLGGWLHQRTYNVAAPILRANRRRHAREKEAAQMNALHTDSDTHLAQVSPILDEAITRLGRDDRKAIILRFFEQRDYRSIGEALGTSDDAAQKRVTRAVAKLRAQLISRGVALSAGAIAAALTSQALTAAPAGLAANVARTALAGAATGTGGTLALLKYMAATKLKTAIIGAAITAGVLIVLFFRQDQKNSAEQSNSPQLPISESASSPVFRRFGDRVRGGLSRSESDAAPPATAQEIVAGKIARFGKSRRELTNALARRHGVEVPDAVRLFFDAVEAGNWDEIDARFKVINGGDSSAGHATGRPPGVEHLWPAIIDAYGAAEQAHLWPAQQLLDYGKSILDSLRPGMVYVGGTDDGRWIPELLNNTSDGERHIVVTQNGLADGGYRDYLTELYGDRIVTLTDEDADRIFQEYITDAQKRMKHDEQFPDEPKQVRLGEKLRMQDGHVQVSGIVGVMAINEKLLQVLLEKNPGLSFGMQESFPMKGTYGDAIPLGPLMELRAQNDPNAFTDERAAQSLDYWRTTAQNVLADPEAAGSTSALRAYSHMANSAANLLAAHNYTAEAEEAYRLSSQLCPYSPEAVGGLASILARSGRAAEARQMLDDFASKYPFQRSDIEMFRESILWTASPPAKSSN